MKRRWAILFWASLSSLIGMSWLTASTGQSLWETLHFALVSMIVANVVAFIAMRRAIPAKWPALVAVCGAAPMTFQTIRIWPYVVALVTYFGPSAVLLFAGTIATAIVAVWILLSPLARPPAPPPVAPARVVDRD